jgi:ketosteroid isomerase-like protein
LIRELFNPIGAKGQRSGVSPAGGAVAPTPALVAAKPSPTLPGPAAIKSPTAAAVTTNPAAANVTTPAQTATVASPTATVVTTVTPAGSNGTKEAEAAVHTWASAWAARDVKAYLAAYGKDFDPPGNMSRSAWEEERRQRITSKAKITVKLENLTVTASGSSAVAKFRQDYKAGGLAVSSRKTLDLVKNGDRWQIVKESTGT